MLPRLRQRPLRSLGALGTTRLFERLCVAPADEAFCERASNYIFAAHALVGQPPVDWALGDLLAEKTWTMAAYDLEVLGAAAEGCTNTNPIVMGPPERLIGEVLRDNGFKRAQTCPFLTLPEMYIYEWVDRAQCGEYQALAEVCAVLGSHLNLHSPASRARVKGTLQIYVLSAPCLSCVSCLRQMQKLLPHVDFRLSIGAASATSKRFLVRT